MYWNIGRMLHKRQQQEGWGASVIPRLSRDLRNELPEVKEFSEGNIGRMIAFYRAYSSFHNFLPQAVAKTSPPEFVQRLVAQLPWAKNVLLMQRIEELPTRCW
jgi:hypothetical protein